MASDSSWLFLEWLVILVYIVSNGLFQKKSKQEGVEDTFLNSPMEFFIFLLHHWKFQDQKQRPLEVPHYFFLVTLGNSTCYF